MIFVNNRSDWVLASYSQELELNGQVLAVYRRRCVV